MDKKKINYKDLPEMDTEARRYFERFAHTLQERGDYWQSDASLLSILAQSYAEYDSLTKVLNSEGLFYTSNGRIYQHPAASTRENNLKSIRELSGYFKLAPKFRADKMKDPAREADPLQKIKSKYSS